MATAHTKCKFLYLPRYIHGEWWWLRHAYHTRISDGCYHYTVWTRRAPTHFFTIYPT